MAPQDRRAPSDQQAIKGRVRSLRARLRQWHLDSRANVLEHQFRRGLRTSDDPRDPRAGMGAGADEIEIGDFRIAVVNAKIGALSQQRLKAECGSEVRAKLLFELDRPEVERVPQSVAKARKEAFFKQVEDPVTIAVRSE